MPYPSVNLEVSPAAVPDGPKPDPSPIIGFRALRHAYTHDAVKCVKCGTPTEQFADADHADGSVTGWVPICEKCAPPPKPQPEKADAAPSPQPTAPDASSEPPK